MRDPRSALVGQGGHQNKNTFFDAGEAMKMESLSSMLLRLPPSRPRRFKILAVIAGLVVGNLESQGGQWQVRRDVLQRAISAALEGPS